MLVLAALSALPAVVVRAAVAAARVHRRTGVLVGLPAALAVMALAGTWVLAPRLGLVGVGAACSAPRPLPRPSCWSRAGGLRDQWSLRRAG